MGVWIETFITNRYNGKRMSHPAWVCGLKQISNLPLVELARSHPAWVCGLKPPALSSLIIRKVTPCVGVWIETYMSINFSVTGIVTPCVGVWIETRHCQSMSERQASHPAWVCGLKQNSDS